MPPFDGSKKALQWGVCTKDPQAKSRRVFLDRLPIDTTREDVLEFFGGQDSVEGMFIGNHFGYVQFKRPIDMTAALKKHNTDFKGKRIIVIRDLKYDKDKQKALPPSRSDSRLSTSKDGSSKKTNGRRVSVSPPPRRYSSTRTTRPRSPSPGWNRGRSRSQSRDRVIPTPPRNSHRGRSRSPSRSSDATDFSSNNIYSRFEPDRNIMAPAIIPPRRHPLANYSHEFRDSVNGAVPFIMPQADQHTCTSQITLIAPGELPNSIDLSLKLVMSQKTAKVLTVNQIQDIITYFESEKAALLNLNGTLVSNGLSIPSQQLFYNANTPAAISYPSNDNLGPQLKPAQFSASREPQTTEVLDVAQQEQLEDVMRLIRDTTR